MHTRRPYLRTALTLALLVLIVAAVRTSAPAAAGMFRDDDPLRREPETQDASGAREWTIDLFVDLTLNLFTEPGDHRTGLGPKMQTPSTRFPTRAGSPIASSRVPSRSMKPSRGRMPARVPPRGRGRSSPPRRSARHRASRLRTRRMRPGSSRSTRAATPRRQPERFSSPTRSSGRSATGRRTTCSSRSGRSSC